MEAEIFFFCATMVALAFGVVTPKFQANPFHMVALAIVVAAVIRHLGLLV